MVEPVFDVGLHLIHDGAGWVVTSIDNSGSAAAAGVMPGDLLSHINGNSVATLSSRQISSLLRGAAGSHCSLSLSRSTMGGGSAHLEASVQRKILSYPDALSPRELPRQQPAKPAAASMSNLHVLPGSSRSPVYADPEDSDPDAEAKLHFQLSLISQRLDEMEQKIRAPSAHSDKLLTPASAPNALAATHPDSASSAVGGGSAIFSLKSPARPPLGHRFSSTSPSVSQSTVAPSPSRTAKSSVVQPLRSPANRAAARPSSASSNITSPSKVGADLSANHAVGHLTPAKLVTSSVSPTVDKARAVKSNLFSPRSANAPNASAPPALASVATAHTETFRSNSQVLPLPQPHQQEPMHQHIQPQQHHIHSVPQHDQQQPLQLQQLLQKLLRQVDEAERQRLELDSLRANDERRRQDTVRVSASLLPLDHFIDQHFQVSSFEARLNKVVAVQDDLWEDISNLRRDVKIAFEDMTSQMNSALAAISRQIVHSSPPKGAPTQLSQTPSQQEQSANRLLASPSAAPSPSMNHLSPVSSSPAAAVPHAASPAALCSQSPLISVHLALLPRAATGIAMIPLRTRSCLIVLPFLSDERLLLGDALLLSSNNIEAGGVQLLTGASKSASLSIAVASPLRIFALNNRAIILPVGASGLLDVSASWIIDVEKASLSKALGPSASSKFQGACACSIQDRFVVTVSSDMTTMVLDSDTLLVKNGTATNLPPVSSNQVRMLFSAASYVACAPVTSSRLHAGHYFVTGFAAHAVSFCNVSDPRNLAFHAFSSNSPENVFERAFIVLGASGFYVLALYENDGDAIDLLRSVYFDVRAGATFSVDSDGSVSRLLQSSGGILPRHPIRCTPKSLSILCGNGKQAVVLVISSSQLELLRCPVALPPRTHSWLCSCVASSPVGWIICLDSEAVPLVMLRVTFFEDINGNTVVSRCTIEQVSAILPSHGVSMLGDGKHTIIASSRKDRDFGDAVCFVGRQLAYVKDSAAPSQASPSVFSFDQQLGSLV